MNVERTTEFRNGMNDARLLETQKSFRHVRLKMYAAIIRELKKDAKVRTK